MKSFEDDFSPVGHIERCKAELWGPEKVERNCVGIPSNNDWTNLYRNLDSGQIKACNRQNSL